MKFTGAGGGGGGSILHGHVSMMRQVAVTRHMLYCCGTKPCGEHSGSVVEHQTPDREVGGSKPTTPVLCPEQDTLPPESTGNNQ